MHSKAWSRKETPELALGWHQDLCGEVNHSRSLCMCGARIIVIIEQAKSSG